MPERSSATPSDRERFDAVWQEFAAALRRARSRAADRPDAELTPAQFHLLAALSDGREATVGDLARAAGVSSPSATRMLDGLERDGLVTREPASDDRRRIAVRTTPDGARALAAMQRRIDDARERIYGELSPDERGQAVQLLRRLAEAIEQL